MLIVHFKCPTCSKKSWNGLNRYTKKFVLDENETDINIFTDNKYKKKVVGKCIGCYKEFKITLGLKVKWLQ